MWLETEKGLYREFSFPNFLEAWAFLSKVALISEKMDHHPDWSNSYNKVYIHLMTHSAGNTITEKDRKLAERIDQVYSP